MPDIGVCAMRLEARGCKPCDHRWLAVARKTKPRAQPPVPGSKRAYQSDKGSAEKPVRGCKGEERKSVGCRVHLRRNDIAQDQQPVAFQQPPELGKEVIELAGR